MADIGEIEKEIEFEPMPLVAPIEEPAAPTPEKAPTKEPVPA